MSPTAELSTQQLREILGSGAVYLDVRTSQEFAAGHVPGAYNIPWQLGSEAGLAPNPDFEATVTANFARDELLLVGCRSGQRAARAASCLRALGFGRIRLHTEGWDGTRDAFGRRGASGWCQSGGAVEIAAQMGREHSSLHRTRPKQALRVAYFGLPLGALLLQRDGHQLQFVVLSPIDAPGKRRLARLVSCPVLDASSLGDGLHDAVDARFESTTADLLVSWFWTRRLPQSWLERPKAGAVGVHPSLLPRHRGPNPYYWAIDSGDVCTGVSAHRLTPAYDEGDVLLTRSIAIAGRNAWQLARALDRPSLALLRRTVQCFAVDQPPVPVAQDPAAVTWAPEPTGEALSFVASWSCERVLRRVRALAPVPGLSLDIEGLELVVMAAHEAAEPLRALQPGQAAVWGAPPQLLLRVADGAIAISRALVLAADGELQLRGAALAAHVAAHLAAPAPALS